MCIAVLSTGAHPRWRLVIAANRDEYHERAADPLARWTDGSGIIAGRDRVGGGTWLGLHEAADGQPGRLVLITNFRVPGYPLPGRPSRGGLVTGLLGGDDPAAVALDGYNPFNLVCITGGQAVLLGNYPQVERRRLSPGIHGVSNGAFDPPWPKTMKLNQRFTAWLDNGGADPAPLFAALVDAEPTQTTENGPEARFSGVFVRDPVYGTRCSTLVLVDHHDRGLMIERRFDAQGRTMGETGIEFRWS